MPSTPKPNIAEDGQSNQQPTEGIDLTDLPQGIEGERKDQGGQGKEKEAEKRPEPVLVGQAEIAPAKKPHQNEGNPWKNDGQASDQTGHGGNW